MNSYHIQNKDPMNFFNHTWQRNDIFQGIFQILLLSCLVWSYNFTIPKKVGSCQQDSENSLETCIMPVNLNAAFLKQAAVKF